MDKGSKILLGVALSFIGLIMMVVMIAVISYVSANNYGAAIESQLKASRDNNQNILSNYYQKINEAVQVPEMYIEGFKEIIRDSMTGRYGPNGSQATFQWLREHDIKPDASVFTKIQQLIEGGRKDYELGQTRMLDIRAGYETQQGYFWRGFWLRTAGFPKVNMEDFKPIITGEVETAYASGKEEKLNLLKR